MILASMSACFSPETNSCDQLVLFFRLATLQQFQSFDKYLEHALGTEAAAVSDQKNQQSVVSSKIKDVVSRAGKAHQVLDMGERKLSAKPECARS